MRLTAGLQREDGEKCDNKGFHWYTPISLNLFLEVILLTAWTNFLNFHHYISLTQNIRSRLPFMRTSPKRLRFWERNLRVLPMSLSSLSLCLLVILLFCYSKVTRPSTVILDLRQNLFSQKLCFRYLASCLIVNGGKRIKLRIWWLLGENPQKRIYY